MANTIKLTRKQDLFCQQYIIDLNATQAAMRAGYSKSTARQTGYENLTKPYIQKRIHELMEARERRVRISADLVVRELMLVAFSDIGEVVEWEDGGFTLKELHEIHPEARKGIRRYIKSDTGMSIVMENKLRALELLCKHLGMFDAKVRDRGVGIEELMKTARTRKLRNP
ncbi:MAG: terminase small subunit [Ectothiorhodospiraceae bacterium]|nr:terminase small subunit [Ectothiorhodospiraceae bacterium]